ncbi:MAG TPA: deoxyguanosinetriphosphate triphosphohydrolase, partial [Candidatus Aminicenantes bacterium]|nr:deoxyguanosinetriphosphate triphosphohydrolase [Candidatus Aminicenantes bacterium]
MNIREELEEIEAKTLSPKASLSRDSKGRERTEALHPFRTAFQRDRDRILHSKSF